MNFELTLRSRFSASSALVLTLTFIAGVVCVSPAFSAEPRNGMNGDIAVTADFDGDGTVDSATLRNNRIALSLSEQHTTIQFRALSDTTAVAASDIDRDGDTDLVSIGARGSLRGWNNQGSGSFVQWTVPPPSRGPSPIWVGIPTWSAALPFLPSILSVRSPSDASLAMHVASLTFPRPTNKIGIHSARAPTDRSLADHSPRAPPQTFTS